jgi:DNA-binding XRE family transcriptional regulator
MARAKVVADVNRWMDDELARDPALRRRVEQRMTEMKLEEELVALREARGWSQDQLARVLGVSQPAVAKMESGSENPTVRTLLRFVTALGGELQIRIRPRPSTKVVGLRRRRARA